MSYRVSGEGSDGRFIAASRDCVGWTGMSGYEMEQDERALASRMTVLDLSLLTVTRSALSSQLAEDGI